MTKTWLDKLCDPLEHPKYPQVKGVLVERDEETDEIIGKCAEGEIACQNNLKLDRDFGRLGVGYMAKLGIPLDLLTMCYPIITKIYHTKNKGTIIVDFENITADNIEGMITSLNDYGFTYPEIIEFLRTTFGDAV